MYIGLRQPREKSEKYDLLVDELIEALRERYDSFYIVEFLNVSLVRAATNANH